MLQVIIREKDREVLARERYGTYSPASMSRHGCTSFEVEKFF